MADGTLRAMVIDRHIASMWACFVLALVSVGFGVYFQIVSGGFHLVVHLCIASSLITNGAFFLNLKNNQMQREAMDLQDEALERLHNELAFMKLDLARMRDS